MVYLALNRQSALQIIALAKAGNDAIWIGSDALSEVEFTQFGSAGVNLSRFIFPLAEVSSDVIQGALNTVLEHHPGETVWVQHVSTL